MLRLLNSPRSAGSPDGPEPASTAATDPLRALAARAARGDSAAEQTLLVAVGPAVLRVARRMLGANHPEVQDVCQESAVAFLSALPRFRGDSSVTHFACRVTVLTAMNARRRARARRPSLAPAVETPDDAADPALSPAALADAAHRRAALRQLLDELPLPQAEALGLHVVLGYTVQETAAVSGVAPNTVRSRLRRGLSALRQRIRADSTLLEVIGGIHE